ncbi:MAG: SDR family oxidoreductase [Bryobacteraceae bacterium]|nr:SDR family oxidoreductase [Bryobacteraceae bacterium]
MELAGKVAIVTGAGRGLGEAIASTLAAAGVHIVAADLCYEFAERTAKAVQNGIRAAAFPLDVGDEKQTHELVERTLTDFGRLDYVVNNAGTDLTVSVEEMPFDAFDRVVRTNLRGPFVMSKTVFPILRERGGGHIVNIASTAAKRAWANASAYHASKWGLLGLSHALHVEGRPHGIKVTAVIAGGMRTPFLLDRFPDLDPGVLQDPRNVAETVRYVLTLPAETVIPEITVLPMRESSWP